MKTDAQKRASKKFYENNKEKVLEWNKKYENNEAGIHRYS